MHILHICIHLSEGSVFCQKDWKQRIGKEGIPVLLVKAENHVVKNVESEIRDIGSNLVCHLQFTWTDTRYSSLLNLACKMAITPKSVSCSGF